MLEKNDFKEIKKIVESSAEDTKKELRKEIQNTSIDLRKEIQDTKIDLQKEIKSSEDRIIKVINREVSDLAEINRAVIAEVDKVDQLEKRVNRLEVKAGIR